MKNHKFSTFITSNISLIIVLLFIFSISSFAQKPKILLPTARENFIIDKYSNNEETWAYLLSKADIYLTYDNTDGATQPTTALALAYIITGDVAYKDKAKALFMQHYINSTDFSYQSSNGMRWAGKWAFMTFTWLYDEWTETEKSDILDKMKIWAEYWIDHSVLAPDGPLRVTDSDHTTSLAETFLMMAVCLEDEGLMTMIEDDTTPLHEAVIVTSGGVDVPTSDILYAKSDWLLNDFVVATYMEDWMEGGYWAEGTKYSPNTMTHWVRAFFINNEVRNISFPTSYCDDVIKMFVHNTFPAYNGFFQNEDVEGVNNYGDYRSIAADNRFDAALHLIALSTDVESKELGQHWLNKLKEIPGTPTTFNGYSGIWRVLFEVVDAPSASPQSLNLETTIVSEGVGFVATRSDWSEDATLLFFQNNIIKVDHEQADALSFDIVHGDAIVTKEMTGYGFNATDSPPYTSTAHNTLLIENESLDGGNNPYGNRGEGPGINRMITSAPQYTFIEADATMVYNRGAGYQPDIYADYVIRKIGFMKDLNMVIVYDNIVIKPEASPRWTKYIQHFQVEPTLTDGVYSAAKDGSKFFVNTIYPTNTVTTVVDESILWEAWDGAEAPENQMKWHISVTNPDSPDNAKYLNILYFDDDIVTEMPTTHLLQSDDMTVTTGNVIGTHIEGTAGEDNVVLFNNDPAEIPIANTISYKITTANQSTHYIYGVEPDTGFDITSTDDNGETIVTVNTGGTTMSTTDGVLSFVIEGIPLAVELLQFEVSLMQDRENVKLSWRTASEINAKGYEVQRMSKSNDWANIGWKNVNSSSNSMKTYHFIDTDPDSDINYYRLKQIDNDGNYDYSNTVNIRLDSDYNHVEIYPNPSTNQIKIISKTNINHYEIYNHTGQSILKGDIINNNSILISALPSGVYLIKLSSDNGIVQKMFVKK